jgi:mRNA interferase RelE/StbE
MPSSGPRHKIPGILAKLRRGSIAVNPYRAGKPLDETFAGYHSARRGTYRVIYRIDEAKHQVEIHSVRRRRDACRT